VEETEDTTKAITAQNRTTITVAKPLAVIWTTSITKEYGLPEFPENFVTGINENSSLFEVSARDREIRDLTCPLIAVFLENSFHLNERTSREV
jgi:hypothetical protein